MKALITILLLVFDAVGCAIAWHLTYLLRSESGLYPQLQFSDLLSQLMILIPFWWGLFLLRGMYRIPIALSRFDEMMRSFKVVLLGIVIIFLLTFDINRPAQYTRLFLLNYGVLIFIFVSTERVIIRSFQRNLRRRGIGLWNAIIVGYTDVGKRLHDQLHYEPVWGFKVCGFADSSVHDGEHLGVPILGGVEDLPEIIRETKAEWILVAPAGQAQEALLEVFDRCAISRVRFMMVADYYQMVIGLVRTLEIHGLPLVEVAPQLVSLTVRIVKRTIDIVAGIIWLLILAVVTPFVSLIIKLDSAGPIFYRQKRVGRGGLEFNLYKFRSMVEHAEIESGAVWATKDDPRITRVGNILRKTHIDELPQFYNVFRGDMSLVGPRPERKMFVEQFKSRIPLYDRRLRIRPGITGWAQVRHKYDESFEDVKEKTRYDLFYVDHISLSLDLKIILSTFLKVFKGQGH